MIATLSSQASHAVSSYFFRRAMRLKRSVTTGAPARASRPPVSMTTNVMSRAVGFLLVDVGDRLHAVEHVAGHRRAVVRELLLAVQHERALARTGRP